MINFSTAFQEGRTDADLRLIAETVVSEIKSKKFKLEDISLRNLAEATLGFKGMAVLGNSESNGSALKEAVAPVRLSAFSHITNQLVTEAGMEGYQHPEFIGDKLVTAETSREDNARKIGIAELDAEALEVPEGNEFPSAQLSDDWVKIPPSVKRGLKIALTKEAVFFDRTGQLLDRAREVGKSVGESKEVRTLEVFLGITNTYVRKDVARNTYVAAADPRINDFTGVTLADYTDIEEANQNFADYVDDRAYGRPIMVGPKSLIVVGDLLATATRIKNTLQIRTTSGSTEMLSSNPVSSDFDIMSSEYLRWVLVKNGISLADARKYWYYGNPKKAFAYRTLNPFAMIEASANHDDLFDRDIVNQWRASERGVAYVNAPWYMQRYIGA